jgi:hypothetical protein
MQEIDKEEATTMEDAKDNTIITSHKTTMDNNHITEGRLQGEDQESREEPGEKEDNTTTTSNTMDSQTEGGDISREISMHARMPTPKVWASPGGITPMGLNSGQLLTFDIVHEGERGMRDEPGPGDGPDKGPQQQPQGLEGDGPGPGDEPDHGLQQQQGLEGEEISCEISRNERMPSLEVWASPGGITPMELRVGQIITSRSLHERDM